MRPRIRIADIARFLIHIFIGEIQGISRQETGYKNRIGIAEGGASERRRELPVGFDREFTRQIGGRGAEQSAEGNHERGIGIRQTVSRTPSIGGIIGDIFVGIRGGEIKGPMAIISRGRWNHVNKRIVTSGKSERDHRDKCKNFHSFLFPKVMHKSIQ